MIDLNLLKTIIRKNASLLSIDAECSLIGELQSQPFFADKDIKSNDPKLVDFDAFGFSWNRQTRDHKLRILAAAYRTHKTLFDASDLLNRIGWEQFTLAQQVVIKNTVVDLMYSAISLFSNQCAAEDFLSGFVGAVKQKEEELNRQIMQSVRAA